MKYEIIKGSEKDFEGAPGWATECVWNDKGSESFCYWLNPKTKTIFNPNWHSKPDCWNEEYGWCNYIKAERRPITEPVVNQQLTTEWDADGFPVVGTECEAKYRDAANAEWIAFRCVGVDCGVAFGWAGNEAVAICKESYEFRPIRSPEDVARDEAIAAMIDHKDDFIQPQTYYHAIYDAIAAGKIPGITLSGK